MPEKVFMQQDLFATGFKAYGTDPPWSTQFLEKHFFRKKEWWSFGGVNAKVVRYKKNYVLRKGRETD